MVCLFFFASLLQDSECVCADGNVVSACRRQQNPCSPSACLNNATCVSRGNDYVCRWDACRRLIEATLAVAFFLDDWNVSGLCLPLRGNKDGSLSFFFPLFIYFFWISIHLMWLGFTFCLKAPRLINTFLAGLKPYCWLVIFCISLIVKQIPM